MKPTLAITLILFFILSACAPEPAAPAEPVPNIEPPKPTFPPQPTNTPEPTQTSIPPTETLEPTPTNPPPTQTPLPEGILFRDDFEGYLQPGWSWMNEDPERWELVEFDNGGWLQITGDKPGGFNEQKNTLMRPLPEGDFVITAHVVADPRQNFHQANIFIFEDANNYIRMNFGFCQPCELESGGYGYFMETIIDNNPFGDLYKVSRSSEDRDVYLRLVNQGGQITGYYATEFGNWQKIGLFGNYFDFVSVGLGATNSVLPEMNVEDIVALFDYFEISQP